MLTTCLSIYQITRQTSCTGMRSRFQNRGPRPINEVSPLTLSGILSVYNSNSQHLQLLSCNIIQQLVIGKQGCTVTFALESHIHQTYAVAIPNELSNLGSHLTSERYEQPNFFCSDFWYCVRQTLVQLRNTLGCITQNVVDIIDIEQSFWMTHSIHPSNSGQISVRQICFSGNRNLAFSCDIF